MTNPISAKISNVKNLLYLVSNTFGWSERPELVQNLGMILFRCFENSEYLSPV